MRQVRRSQDGVTLVELIVTVVIMSLIIGGLAASFVTAFNSTGPNSARIRESNDAQIIAGFLVRDAQSAGGSDPTTGTINMGIGVSKTDAAGCNPDASLKLRFSWIDHVTTTISHTHVANYYYDSPSKPKQLVRTTCTDGGSPSSTTLGSNIDSVTTTCSPDCDALHPLPNTVSITVTGTKPATSPAPYSYTLTASLRPENQDAPSTSNSVPIPLLVLGGMGCVSNTTGFDVGGNAAVTIYGQVDVDTTDLPGCPAMFKHGSVNYISGSISILRPGTCQGCAAGSISSYSTPFGDPYASTLQSLGAPCSNGGSNPTPGPNGYQPPSPGQPLVFPNAVDLGNVNFLAGTYVFCHGITGAGTVTTPAAPAPGVTFYIVNGGLAMNAGASLKINGLVYAPTSLVQAHGHIDFEATSIAVGAFVVQGNDPIVVLGTKPAVSIQITGPDALPAWTVGRQYPDTPITAIGGGGFYSWSATGLPNGLSINPGTGGTGVISGTPTAAGGSTVIVSVVDQLGDLTSKTYTLTIGGPVSITGPPSLTDWTINRDYPGTAIIATGGTTPYTWSASGLPTGLSINPATGVVSGTPSATGTFTATINLTDFAGATATPRNYTIHINSPPTITGPASLPNGVVGKKYANNVTMTATNGTLPYKWAASDLPTGLVIDTNTGVISGTPTAAGTFSVSVTLTDLAGASDTRNYSVTITPAVGIQTTSLPNAEQGQPYNFTLTPAPGGTPPYTWSLITAPAWLSIGANTGTLSGTPPAAGAPTVTVQITDSIGDSAQKTYVLTIAPPVRISGPASLTDWTVSRDYPGTQIIVTTGVAPFTWSATGLPAGVSIDANGVIKGTPSATGTASVTVTVVDAYGVTDTQSYTVTINPPPSITTTSLPDGEQTVAYNPTNIPVVATNGTLPYTWAASGLPGGLSMNPTSGVLSGTPTTSGTFSITITVTDKAGASTSRTLSLNLNTAPVGGGTLPNWTVGRPYPNPQLTGSGGTAPYTFTVTTGALPSGLALNANTGIVSGTPNAVGSSAFTVTVRDAVNATATLNFSITINAAPNITTGSLPSWTVGRAYPSTTITRTGGTLPLGWTATGLPSGLTIDPSSGVISGTPTATGTFASVLVTLTDAAGASTTHAAYSITINALPTITTSSYSHDDKALTFQLLETGGTAPFTWSMSGAPAWLSLNSGTGVLSGNPPKTPTTYTFTVTLTDASGASTSITFTLTVT